MWLLRGARFLFAAYALVVFIASLLLMVPLYVIVFSTVGKSRAPYAAHRLSRAWAAVLMAAYLIRVRVENRDLIDPRRTYVFIANHRSLIDIPVYALSCRNTFRFLAKAELTRIPGMGYVIRRLYVTVDRADKRDRSRSMDAMKKSIDEGISVFICPEGTRNRTARPLLDFKEGAFRLAILTQTPVALLTLNGTARLLDPRRPAELQPGRVEGTWSTPIETAGMTESDLPRLRQRAFDEMMKSLKP